MNTIAGPFKDKWEKTRRTFLQSRIDRYNLLQERDGFVLYTGYCGKYIFVGGRRRHDKEVMDLNLLEMEDPPLDVPAIGIFALLENDVMLTSEMCKIVHRN